MKPVLYQWHWPTLWINYLHLLFDLPLPLCMGIISIDMPLKGQIANTISNIFFFNNWGTCLGEVNYAIVGPKANLGRLKPLETC